MRSHLGGATNRAEIGYTRRPDDSYVGRVADWSRAEIGYTWISRIDTAVAQDWWTPAGIELVKSASLSVTEAPLPAAAGRVATPLRLVASTRPNQSLMKLPYPSKANGLQRAAAPNQAQPATPPADWSKTVPSTGKPFRR